MKTALLMLTLLAFATMTSFASSARVRANAKMTSTVGSEWCADSPRQLCRMRCPVPDCSEGECALRKGSCCAYECQKKAKRRKVEWCADSPLQMCKMLCSQEIPTCSEGECGFRTGKITCCDYVCKRLPPKAVEEDLASIRPSKNAQTGHI